ncbi:hypothetical protein BSIN_2801 [Burkholderia singularis]|uniref:Uncharacterized protein n=1 Tax=Burkholderia singularis TaxID=1503053 RepID=A0A238H342_9BURK|nr:hypothetical protein BSIN_2801 [Burkholderia singularis]
MGWINAAAGASWVRPHRAIPVAANLRVCCGAHFYGLAG